MIHYALNGFPMGDDYSGFNPASQPIPLRVVYIMLLNLADTCFMLLLILLAKGWTVVRRKISATGRVKIATYTMLYGCSLIWSQFWIEDNGSEAFFRSEWESSAGMTVQVLRLVAVVWFCYSVFTSLRQFQRKLGFYYKFATLFGLYLTLLPAYVGMASAAAETDRTATTKICTVLTQWCGMFFLAIMYNPTTK